MERESRFQSATPLNIDTISQIDVACKSDSTGEMKYCLWRFGSAVAVQLK